jgi:hypothetical protein
MSDALGGRMHEPGARRSLTTVYIRGAAMLLLLAGLARACLILGITPDGQSFATLTPAWRVGAATLMLLDLLAAVGLWVGAAWGPVMWAVGLAVEVSMYTLFPALFGSYPGRVAAHGLLFAGFLVLSFLDWRRSLSQ